MPNYNFYALNDLGRIAAAERGECDDDFKALERAKDAGHAHAVEVWEGRRRVGRVAPPADD